VELITSRAVVREELRRIRSGGGTVGFVPTMGALHGGHLSLVRAAREGCDCVAVSIFVNPTQFGDAFDLAAYPRDLEQDLSMCAATGVDFVFGPPVEEMYPEGSLDTAVVPGSLAEVLEGPSRPGHFSAMATVVTKLLAIVGSCRAYFGEKDFQQLAVVRRLVADLDLPVEVVGCPTVREEDGVAMSSRNLRLGASERQAATALLRALLEGTGTVARGERAGATVARAMAAVLEAEPLVALDYAAVADPRSLQPVDDIDSEVRLLVAATVGPVRLIDNMAATPPAALVQAR